MDTADTAEGHGGVDADIDAPVPADTDTDIDASPDTDPATQAAAQQARITAVLDDLAASGLLSDERTAESVRHSHSTRYGQHRLKHTLQAKGLGAELVQATLQRAQSSELARASEVWRRRWGSPPATAAERARQQRFLAARGFSGDVIRQVLRLASTANGADTDTEFPTEEDPAPETADD